MNSKLIANIIDQIKEALKEKNIDDIFTLECRHDDLLSTIDGKDIYHYDIDIDLNIAKFEFMLGRCKDIYNIEIYQDRELSPVGNKYIDIKIKSYSTDEYKEQVKEIDRSIGLL